MKLFSILLLLLSLCSLLILANQDAPLELPTNDEVLGPEWRELDPHESVPQGSHVKLNMSNGKRHVKLEKTRGEQILSLLEVDDQLKPQIDSIRAQLSQTNNHEQFEQEALRLWEVRQGELKEHHETRAEKLLKQVKQQNYATSLQELDEFVEEIDDAIQFANLGGLPLMLSLLENTDNLLDDRIASLGVFAKSIKAIPELQAKAMELNSLQRVFDVVLLNAEMENKALFFYGALLRGMGSNGVTKVLELDEFPKSLFSNVQHRQRNVRIRAANLISDLLMEDFTKFGNAMVANTKFCQFDIGKTGELGDGENAFDVLQQNQVKLCGNDHAVKS